jgi:hypothetical protein
MSRYTLLLTVILTFIAIVLVACGEESRPYTLAHESSLPAFLDGAASEVRTAYRFAINNAHELEKYPCYCGCGAMGHTSNRGCYLQNPDGSNRMNFDTHAAYCGICVAITLDVMRGLEAGQSSREIRTTIDATYSAYGPPMDTPLPE